MAITGIDTIDGKQIIAAGAVSAKSAEMAYNDENGNPITGYLTAVPEGYATTGDLTAYQTTAGMTAYQEAGEYYSASNPSGFLVADDITGKLDASVYATDSGSFLTAVPDTYLQNTDLTISDGKVTEISGVPLSAGSTPAYGYTDNDLISAIDSSGLYATSALEAVSANAVKDHGTLGYDLSSYLPQNTSYFYWMPSNSPWTTADYATGIFSPLQYATGACLAMNNPTTFKGYFKGNEWFIANTVSNVGQMLRGEVHKTRGVHISGATTAGYGFDLGINNVSGVNSTGSWKYGHDEDAALRTVSSCDMHESAFEYDSNDKISGYNGSAFAGGSDVPEGVMVESGLEYNAVNEISGYNGSAIAQYGAEKQWLVHDDTLVHAANSAQYALGVNLSAVAQLLGVDETVLWSGDAISGISASESMTGFNRIRIKYSTNTNSSIIYGSVHEYKEIDPSTLDHDFTIGAITNNGSNSTNNMLFINTEYSATSNYTVLNMVHSYQLYNNAGTWTTGTNNSIRIKELVGIGRKQ